MDYWNTGMDWNGYLSHEMLIGGGGGGGGGGGRRQGMDWPGTWFCSCLNETLVRQCVFYHCNVPCI